MDEFVTMFTTLFSGVFNAVVEGLSSIGQLVFTVSETTGAVSGVAPFGWLLIVGISVPLATWLFSAIFTWLRGLGRRGR